MRKIKLLSSLSLVVATAQLPLIASCSSKTTTTITNDYEHLIPIVKNDAIEQFKEIVPIPRPTYHLGKIRTYYNNLIQKHGYVANRDDYGNMWFDIPANNESYANYPKIILQGHMDMVFTFDKSKFPEGDPDPTEYEIEVDETVDSSGYPIIQTKDNKTSLGGDNSMGVAMALAIAFNNEIKHGPLRIILTADEETGVVGAGKLDPAALDSDYLINLDGGPQYVMFVSAKGASQCQYTKTFDTTLLNTIPAGKHVYEVSISGLGGGHSGIYILDGRANALFEANKILADSSIATSSNNIQLINWECPGVSTANSIIHESKIMFMSDNDILTTLTSLCSTMEDRIHEVWADGDAVVEAKEITNIESNKYSYISNTDTANVTKLVSDLGYGVREGVTSQNIGPITWEHDLTNKKLNMSLRTYSRSDLDEMIDTYTEENETKSEALGYEFENLTKYYPWHRNDDDKMTKIVTAAWESFGHQCLAIDCPAGLEPTWFKQKRPTINAVAIGAYIKDCHKYTETVYVDSLDATIQALLYTIDHINEYE